MRICTDCSNEAKNGTKCSRCYSRIWRERNPHKTIEHRKADYERNKEKIKVRSKQWAKNNKEASADIHKQYIKRSNYYSERYATDLNFRLRVILRNRLIQSVKTNAKAGSAVQDLGCSIEEFKRYLESKFQPDMTWDNIGEWHIDHIQPLSKYDLTSREQFLEACHYRNMQPLWKSDNLKKSNN